jgi:hypothetical protein
MMDGAEDWIEADGMNRWLAMSSDWVVERSGTTLVTPDRQQRIYQGKWLTKVPSGRRRKASQHSYVQLSARIPRYQQQTIASSLKQRLAA